MRKTLMIAALFASTLIAGSASAERPTENLRSRGDVVDKVYRVAAPKDHSLRERTATPSRSAAPNKAAEKAEPRWRCETDDCSVGRAEVRSAAAEKRSAKADDQRPEKVDERIAARWNCDPDVQECKVDGHRASTTPSRSPASSKAGKEAPARSKVEPDAHAKRDPAAQQLSPAEAAKGQRMVQLIKSKICERMGGECGGDE